MTHPSSADSSENILCSRIRLGHAYWSTPTAPQPDEAGIEQVLDILDGKSELKPRVPQDGSVVLQAETLLGLTERIVYTFLGCLHPKLGTIGIIIKQDCMAGRLSGITRCDTGGLVGRKGSFAFIQEADVKTILNELTMINPCNGWQKCFDNELKVSYANSFAYVSGGIPDCQSWTDARKTCIQEHKKVNPTDPPDRRLWTWEIRLTSPPNVEHYDGLVLSPEAFKCLESLRQQGRDVPSHIKLVYGKPSPVGVHYFEENNVAAILNGDSIHG